MARADLRGANLELAYAQGSRPARSQMGNPSLDLAAQLAAQLSQCYAL